MQVPYKLDVSDFVIFDHDIRNCEYEHILDIVTNADTDVCGIYC